jgi:hypothetical protein
MTVRNIKDFGRLPNITALHRLSVSEGKSIISNNQNGLRQDDLYLPNEAVLASKYISIPTRRGFEKAIVSNGKLVHLCSKDYGYVPNLHYFGQMENKLAEADIKVLTRSTNSDDRQFMADYILCDEKYHVHIKNGMDKLRPMITLTNSYDGKIRTMGSFGFFRELCKNGLHSSVIEFGFSQVHRGEVVEIVLPKIQELIDNFMSNQFYELKRKYEVLAEKVLTNVNEYVEMACEDVGIFAFESEKTKEITNKAKAVIDRIHGESKVLNTEPNCWIAYNAFNFVLYDKVKKAFTSQFDSDTKLFDHAYQYALN